MPKPIRLLLHVLVYVYMCIHSLTRILTQCHATANSTGPLLLKRQMVQSLATKNDFVPHMEHESSVCFQSTSPRSQPSTAAHTNTHSNKTSFIQSHEHICDLYSTQNVSRRIKRRTLGLAGHLACMEKNRSE